MTSAPAGTGPRVTAPAGSRTPGGRTPVTAHAVPAGVHAARAVTTALDLGTGPAAEAVQPRWPTRRGSCPHGRAQAECSAAVRAAPAVRALRPQIRPDE